MPTCFEKPPCRVEHSFPFFSTCVGSRAQLTPFCCFSLCAVLSSLASPFCLLLPVLPSLLACKRRFHLGVSPKMQHCTGMFGGQLWGGEERGLVGWFARLPQLFRRFGGDMGCPLLLLPEVRTNPFVVPTKPCCTLVG